MQYLLISNIHERRITMSVFIYAIVLILFALLAVGIGLLVLVCWALATAAGRYDCYLEKHSNKS